MKKSSMFWEYVSLLCSLKVIKIMRNILILMVLTVFQAFATDSYSQNTRLTLKLNDVTVENILNTIEDQSEFYFLCNKKLVDVNRKVNVHLENRTSGLMLWTDFNNGDVYCFQEEWKTEGHGEILKRLMPLKSKGQWHIHKVQGNVIASKYPLQVLPSKNDRYAAAYIELAENRLFIINVHLKAMGYIDSREDRLRVRQVNDILAAIDEIYKGKYNKDDAPDKRPAIVMLGDFNLVGSRKPLDMLIDKKDYSLKDWLIPNLIGESIVTWRGGPRSSFSPGKLDYIVYSTGTLIPKNGFLTNSELLNRTERRQLKLDAADSKISDHLLITVDFKFSDSGKN